MWDVTQARKALVTRILEGDGEMSRAQRRAAFDNAGLCPTAEHADREGHQTRLPGQRRHRGVEEGGAAHGTRATGDRA